MTWNSESSEGRIVRADSECKVMYVAEVIRGMKLTTVDEDRSAARCGNETTNPKEN